MLKEVQQVEGSGAGNETPSSEKATEEGGRETTSPEKATEEGGRETTSPEKATEEGGRETTSLEKAPEEGGRETTSLEKATEEGGKKEEGALTTPQAGQRRRSMTPQPQTDSDILAEMGCLVDGVTESDLQDTEGVLNKIRTGEMCDPFEVSLILLLY